MTYPQFVTAAFMQGKYHAIGLNAIMADMQPEERKEIMDLMMEEEQVKKAKDEVYSKYINMKAEGR